MFVSFSSCCHFHWRLLHYRVLVVPMTTTTTVGYRPGDDVLVDVAVAAVACIAVVDCCYRDHATMHCRLALVPMPAVVSSSVPHRFRCQLAASSFGSVLLFSSVSNRAATVRIYSNICDFANGQFAGSLSLSDEPMQVIAVDVRWQSSRSPIDSKCIDFVRRPMAFVLDQWQHRLERKTTDAPAQTYSDYMFGLRFDSDCSSCDPHQLQCLVVPDAHNRIDDVAIGVASMPNHYR